MVTDVAGVVVVLVVVGVFVVKVLPLPPATTTSKCVATNTTLERLGFTPSDPASMAQWRHEAYNSVDEQV